MTQSPQSGRIELVIGPMFAGKTTELMSRVNRNFLASHSCYVIKYSKDMRYSKEVISTHDRRALIIAVSVGKLGEVGDKWHEYDVIAVDEGQFFQDILEFCSMAANAGKKVIVAALDNEYRNAPFENIAKLIPAAESVTKLSAVCMSCKSCDAHYTHRTVQSEQRELIGGADMYNATCRACNNRLNSQGGSLAENPKGPQSGRIELVIGPMFAGKTTELMSRVNRNYLASHSCYVIKYSKDVRYSKEIISTHDQRTLTATVSVSKLSEIGNAWCEHDVIAVDGGQFFPDILQFCSMAANAGKKVIVSALDGDYRNEPFEDIAKLIPAAESVTKLSAVCMSCKSCDAYYTHRTVQSEQRELIGGADMYIATCRACYNRLNNQGGSLVENPQIQQSGRIELVIGPMFAGKTTELISRVNRNYLASQRCYVIRYSKDVRYSKEMISTQHRLSIITTVSLSKLSEVGDKWRDYDVIAVDEGQFFPDILEFCSMAANAGKKVIVAALDGDYRNEPFEDIAKLIPAAESVTKLAAVCMSCKSCDAHYTHRTVQSEQRELIGGADMYNATCRACNNRLNSQGGSLAENPKGPQSGRIELVIGPMFAGKTTELMSRVNRNYLASHSCYVIKYSKDVRYSKEIISTHDQRTLTATVSVSKLSEIGNAWCEHDVIAVDGGQFFPDILQFCSMAANAGKKVIVSALDGDYRNEPFEDIAKLIPAAESVTKLSAVCMSCKSCDAYYTHRTVQSEQRELIGGADMYIATCRACYNRLNNQGGSLVENPQIQQSGRIELVIGPMFAGKTTELISRVNRNYLASQRCYVIRYSKDVRYSKEMISTQHRLSIITTVSLSKLSEVGDKWRDYDVIAVDEGQFFPDILEFCSMAANAGKKVIVAALDGDYRNEPFEDIAKLIPAAESVTKLAAVCMSCRLSNAYYTHRTVQSEQRELIGGAGMYIATCRACYNRLNNQGGSLVENPEGPQGGVAALHTVEDANELRSAGAAVAPVDASCRDSGGSRTATSRSLPDAKLPGKRQRSPLESPSSPVDEKPVRKLC